MPKKAVQKAGGDGEEAPAQRAEAAAPAAEEQKVHKPDKNERERLKKEKAGAAPAGEEAKPHKPDQAERKRKREERAGASAAAAGAEGGGGGEEKAGGNKGAKRAKPDPPGTVYPILVRGLGGVSIVDLQDLFSECGTIKHVRITGQGKAIIDFETRVAAATAVKLDGSDVDGNKIRVATLMPTLSPEAEAAQKPEAVPVDEEGYTYTVIVNSIPAGTTKEEVSAAAAKHGVVVFVKMDKKREGVAFVEYAPSAKSGARAAAKKSIFIGRTICKTVRLKPTASEEVAEVAEKPMGLGGKKNTSTTALARALPDAVTVENLSALFEGCGEIKSVRLAATPGGKIAFVEFATKTSFRKGLKKKGTPFLGVKLDISAAKKVVATATAGPVKAPKPKPPTCRTVIIKNLPFYLGDNEEKVKSKIKRVFKVCGSVKEVRPFMDRNNDDATFKGMAYVEFGEPESADAALKMDGRENDGRNMKIDWSESKEVTLKKRALERKGREGSGGIKDFTGKRVKL